MRWGVCRGAWQRVRFGHRGKKPGNPFLSGHGRALRAQLQTSPPVLLSDAPAAVGGCRCAEKGQLASGSQSWACSGGLCQDVFLGCPSRAWESMESRPDGTFFLQRSFSVWNRWGFLFSLFVLSVSKTWTLRCPACRTKACTTEYSCTRGYEKLHHVDLIIVTLVAS